MTNIEKVNFGHTAQSSDGFNEYPEKLEENNAYPHITQRKPLTIDKFKAWINSDVLTDEDVIKAVYDALPYVNSNAFYRNGSIHLRFSPMESLLREYQSEAPIVGKFNENKLLLLDIIQVMDEYGKASEPDESILAQYAHALAKASICYVDDKYDGKENN